MSVTALIMKLKHGRHYSLTAHGFLPSAFQDHKRHGVARKGNQ